jgi:hypothetical protein
VDLDEELHENPSFEGDLPEPNPVNPTPKVSLTEELPHQASGKEVTQLRHNDLPDANQRTITLREKEGEVEVSVKTHDLIPNRSDPISLPVLNPNLTSPLQLHPPLDPTNLYPEPSITKKAPHHPTSTNAPVLTTPPTRKRVHLTTPQVIPPIKQTIPLDSAPPSATAALPHGKPNLEDKVFIKQGSIVSKEVGEGSKTQRVTKLPKWMKDYYQ